MAVTIKPLFVPKTDEEHRISTEVNFRVDVQQVMHKLMLEKGITQADLAIKLGCSRARISQLFSDSSNITVKTLANIFHALGEKPKLSTEEEA